MQAQDRGLRLPAKSLVFPHTRAQDFSHGLSSQWLIVTQASQSGTELNILELIPVFLDTTPSDIGVPLPAPGRVSTHSQCSMRPLALSLGQRACKCPMSPKSLVQGCLHSQKPPINYWHLTQPLMACALPIEAAVSPCPVRREQSPSSGTQPHSVSATSNRRPTTPLHGMVREPASLPLLSCQLLLVSMPDKTHPLTRTNFHEFFLRSSI